MLGLIKGIFMAIAVTVFLIIILSLGAIGFIVFTAIMLGYFVSCVNKGLKKAGL